MLFVIFTYKIKLTNFQTSNMQICFKKLIKIIINFVRIKNCPIHSGFEYLKMFLSNTN